MGDYLGKDIPKLGFGLMRLPKLADGKNIDIEETKRMVDAFLAAGMKYFDTAYVYDGGLSEKAAKEALVDRYPRESFYLATKLNTGAQGCVDEETAKKQLFTSLERTGAGYFDFYLLHALGTRNRQSYEDYHLWDFVKEMKEKGLIRHYGFSFHDKPEVLDDLLTKHPDAEFVQLQINYADWDAPNVQSRECLEVARKHGKSVTVMEPVKGGTLAVPPERVQQIFRAADPVASFPSWAIRFVASQDGIITVLSGMSNLARMEDNLSYMKDFKPLNEEEMETVFKVTEILKGQDFIGCLAVLLQRVGHHHRLLARLQVDHPHGLFLLFPHYLRLVAEGHAHLGLLAVDQYLRAVCCQNLVVVGFGQQCAGQNHRHD